MAFVLELETVSSQDYLKNYLISIIREHDINANVYQKEGRIIAAMDAQNVQLSLCLEAIGAELPASVFLTSSRHHEIEGEPETLPEFVYDHPLGLGLCPQCQKELFDPSSKRYYYPFTSCSHCGGQYAFFEHYPFNRSNSAMRSFHECVTCKAEASLKGRHEGHHLISCHECGIPVKLSHKGKERYANDAGSFRTLFEVAAKAVRDGATLLLKSTLGYRKFYLADAFGEDSILMLINASKITHYCAMIEAEFHALLSIERPILHVALKDETLKHGIGFSCDVKYPDDGFNLLLCKELGRLGFEYIAYEETDVTCKADYVIDFDLHVNTQKGMRLFIDKDTRLMVDGERVAFPATSLHVSQTLSVANGLAGVYDGALTRFDQSERFERASASKVLALEHEPIPFEHSNIQTMSPDEATFMTVIVEHKRLGKKVVGAYFEDEPSLLYYDGKKVIRVVPPMAFDASTLLEKMATLREGSDRLVARIIEEHPQLHKRLTRLEAQRFDLFEAVSIVLELECHGYRGVVREALKFVGKGGLQIDTKVSDNRFDHTAFLASIISYKLAGVENTLLCYSIFESFGDYFSELLQEIQSKTKAHEVALCGKYFANASLFSRMMRNLKQTPPLLPLNMPISSRSSVVGGVYL